MLCRFDPVTVPRWSPALYVSDAVAPSAGLDTFRHRAPARFEAPEIVFSAPQPLLVTGDHFTTVAEQGGLLRGSTYLFAEYRWATLLSGGAHIVPSSDRLTIIAANNAWRNYWHWTFQCLAPVAVACRAGIDFVALTPPLDQVMRDGLALCGLGRENIVELAGDAVTLVDNGVHSNLTAGDFAFLPHPVLVDALAHLAAAAASPAAGRRVYVARSDSPNRSMVNEAILCDRLARAGFEIVEAGRLSLGHQIALFREASLVVAPHGAALTNLLFASDRVGPCVIELHQEDYLHQAFLKLCQVKNLPYASVVSHTVERGSSPHASRWEVDIPLVLKAIEEMEQKHPAAAVRRSGEAGGVP